MILKRINLWPALPILILVAAAVASRLLAEPAESENPIPAEEPLACDCCVLSPPGEDASATR